MTRPKAYALLAFLGVVWLASVAMAVDGFRQGLSAPGRWSGFVVMLVVTALASALVVLAARRLRRSAAH
ncbi:hypothetical protein DFJ67_5281 [Asanoa ferruginea]|uniref:Uncharacterized protein n=1 Tax=Asanoa ferruginea TaxID=53367 RepID=A0A3D9ZPF0_9ACTN|nr:hypothetical protein [Asanoa ferruginea]REF99248.1 hypothetical protein DFJ67_5281 [Asanoa ferruginea]GIF45846.1 hypothetical protein Afe04nite_03850 [Asanoa ferruginea]